MLNPIARAARITTRLRLTPGHRAKTCTSPITNPSRTVMASRARPFLPAVSGQARMTIPPTNQAATTGHGPKRRSLMVLPRARPTIAAGRNPTAVAASRRRPPTGSDPRPTIADSAVAIRCRYRPTTARIAPAWIAMA